MATCPGIDVTVLWLQLGANDCTPVLCVRCDDKGHCLLQSARNLALDENVRSLPREINRRLDQEVCEALRGQESSIWHVGECHSCIVEGGEGVRAVGIASTSKERTRATLLSIAMSLRVHRHRGVPGDVRQYGVYGEEVCEKLRCLELQVVDLMRADGDPPAVRPPFGRHPWPADTAAAARSHAAAPAVDPAVHSSTGNTVPLKDGVRDQYLPWPWKSPLDPVEKMGVTRPSASGPPPGRLLPPAPPPSTSTSPAQSQLAKKPEKEIFEC